MGIYRVGSKEEVEQAKASGDKSISAPLLKRTDILEDAPAEPSEHPEHSWLRDQVAFLQKVLLESAVPAEVIKHVEVPVEVVKYIDREIHSVKEFPVFKEKIVKEFVEIPVEVIKEVEREVIVKVKFVPMWSYGVMLVQTIIIVALMLK